MPNPSETLTLADLENWNRRDAAGNFLPSLAVLGHPVAHSVSPQMHNAALAMLAEKYPQLKEWQYFKFQIEPDRIQDALDLLRQKNFRGVNLTIPFKETVMSIERQERYSEAALAMGAVNTLKPVQERGWQYDNSDGYGFAQALFRDLNETLHDKTVIIFGAGGAARGAVSQCLKDGSRSIWVGNRDKEKREALLSYFNPLKPDPLGKIQGFDLQAPPFDVWPNNAIVINATSLGMKHEDPLPFDVSLLGDKATIFDMVYNRDGLTRFVSLAKQRGLKAVDGLGMLIWQGAKSLSIWLQGQEGIEDIKPEQIAQTMMDAVCKTLGLPHRHA